MENGAQDEALLFGRCRVMAAKKKKRNIIKKQLKTVKNS